MEPMRPVEPRMTGYLFSKATRAKLPLSGTFELSPVCNFTCRMCYVRKTAQDVRESPRPMLTMERWLDLARQAREQGMLYLLLTGGEPLLWPDFWPLYEQLIRMGFLISINTNGSLIDDEAVARFRRLPPTRINITLYGASDATYERLCGAKNVFARVDHAIRALKSAGITVKLNGSLTPQNIGDLAACVEYASALGLIYEPVTYMFPPLRRDPSLVGTNDRFTPAESAEYGYLTTRLLYGEEAYRARLRAVRNGSIPPPGLDENCVDPVDGSIRCRAGKASFWLTWDGWMTPCGMMTEPRIETVGRPFADAWRELTEASDRLRLSGACAECANRDLCHSCAAMAQAETGSVSGIPRYLCETVREMRRIAERELAGTDI